MSESKDADTDTGVFSGVKELPPDAIFFTKARYQADTAPNKVNLGIGAYRDDTGKPKVLPIVRKVEKEMANDPKLNKEYLPIGGDQGFVKLSQELILGKDSKSLKSGFVTGVQGISGTGSLRLLFNFIANNFDKTKIKVLISNPTWGNHKKVIAKAGLSYDMYSYWDAKKRCLDEAGMLKDLKTKGKPGDVVLLHACAHNPTGVDPTKEQWKKIADLIKECKLIPFFDSAYQGFATGNLDNDAYGVRLFDSMGFSMFIAQSYAKNLGLYCERVGCASIVTCSVTSAKACFTQLNAIIRPMYSNPPAHGARIVKAILGDENNRKQWNKEMAEMSNRIILMRKYLRGKLEELKTPGTWNHITDQIGMFTFSGLTPEQCDVMEKKFHIYLLRNGRISMAGVASNNYEYLAKSIDYCVRNVKPKSDAPAN
mmetsp:Transcript_36056/g.44490  ORF Transcript_36056/g.44490 Transcript_36056/m.44490 type:complete len:426 (+) Transcript_36056:91-1368(+)